MNKCPHCGKQGISVLRKLNMGLLIPTTCNQCGNEVRIPYYGYFVITLIISVNVSVRFIDYSIMLKIAICVVVTLIIGFIYIKYVPLVPDKK